MFLNDQILQNLFVGLANFKTYSVKWEKMFPFWLTAVQSQINTVHIANFVARALKLMEMKYPI